MTNKKLQPIIDTYIVEDEVFYAKIYGQIEWFAKKGEMINTSKALPLARIVHNGQYRKSTVIYDGKERHLPYVLHVLKVCKTLLLLNLPLSNKELDIMASMALLHDCIEDNPGMFPNGGDELVTEYGFPQEVCDGVKLLTKRHGATQEELSIYFNSMKKNKLAVLCKLADRSHNSESLFIMRTEKLHEYVKETRDFIYPLAEYGKQNYPELSNGLSLLKSKINSLTEATEILVEMYEEKLLAKDAEIQRLSALLEQDISTTQNTSA